MFQPQHEEHWPEKIRKLGGQEERPEGRPGRRFFGSESDSIMSDEHPFSSSSEVSHLICFN
jgi:hypothetical protein